MVYFKSDTTGEKAYEEFYVSGEKINMDRFCSLGVIEDAHGTVIRVRARRNLHFGNCPVLSRIGERPESRINGHAQILAGVGVLQRACSFGNKLQEKALLALAHFTHDPTVLHFSGLCGIRLILQSPGEPVVALVNANTESLFSFSPDPLRSCLWS